MSLPSAITSNVGNNKTLELEIVKAFLLAKQTCSSPWVLSYSTLLPGVKVTFHELMIILGVVACCFNCLGAMYLVSGHLYHWVKPNEQRQIIRIIMFIPIMSLACFFTIYFYKVEGFLRPVADYYEGLAITALFFLYVQYACPDPQERARYFSNLERRWYNGKRKGTGGSLRWYRIIWISVVQLTFVRIIVLVADEVLWGLTCPLSEVRAKVSIAIQVVQGISTSIAVAAVIFFERRPHSELKPNHGLLKLISFKGVVWLEATQNILFAGLAESGVYFPKPPYHVSWADFDVGIPEFILLWEVTIMTIIFLWGYTSAPYADIVRAENAPIVPTWKAFFSAFDFRDIWQGVKYMFTAFTKSTYLEGPTDRASSDFSGKDLVAGNKQAA